MPEQEPSKRTVQMYDRPANADRPALPIGRIAIVAVVLIVAALVAAKFLFHIDFGHLLHAGH